MTSSFYQSHSNTSREAAKTNISARALREKIYDYIAGNNTYGCIGDELAGQFSVAPGTISARLRDLELSGRIIKTNEKRKTLSSRNANVYVAKHIFINSGLERDISKGPTDLEHLRAENFRMKNALEDIAYAKTHTLMNNARWIIETAFKGLGK